MDGTQSFPEIVKLLIENGLQSTLILFFLTLIFGLILGMIIAKGRMSKLLIIQMPIRFFLLIMRGTPLILQLYGFYFGLYYIAGLSLDRMTAAVIGFSLNYAAYFAEIYRSGIQAIPKGVEICYRLVEDEFRRVVGLALYQLFDYRNVPVIYVRVGYDMDELARLKS